MKRGRLCHTGVRSSLTSLVPDTTVVVKYIYLATFLQQMEDQRLKRAFLTRSHAISRPLGGPKLISPSSRAIPSLHPSYS